MKLSWKHSLSAAAIVLLLAACGGGNTNPTGAVQGTLTRASSTGPASVKPASSSEEPAIVPGGFFVAFERGRPDFQLSTNEVGVSLAAAEGFGFQADGGFTFQGVEFTQERAYPTRSGLAFYKAPGLDEAATRELVEELQSKSSIRGAYPNWILHQLAVPNDELYDVQAWHYEQLNLPAAWDIQDGTDPVEPVHVAVLDSGAFAHPDIAWAEEGANFVNWEDGAPEEGPIDDPMTLPGGSDHGTHVAGTIGAITNNTDGVAGVNWGLNPIPVKVLSAVGSGSFFGIMEGVYWAAGDDDASYGGHVNPTPARVANLSLGANVQQACPPMYNEVFEEVFQTFGMISVVAAGNDASATDIMFPANCDAVITVGATDHTGARAYYSNYGPHVDVFAPGGDVTVLHPELELPAGVFSTVDPDNGEYAWFQGTSMAAPHVTGIISLMLAEEPDLTREEVTERLVDASMPLSETECNVPAVGFEGLDLCGAGLLDAEAALLGTNLTAEQLGATVYAVRYEGEEAPEIGLGDLGSLENLASFSTAATRQASGAWTYQLTGLLPGNYLVIGVEQRNPGGGVNMLDRFGVEEVTVVAGQTRQANIVATPVWMLR